MIPTPGNAGNEYSFQEKESIYLGTTAVAISMNIGMREKWRENAPVNLYEDSITISEALSDSKKGNRSLLANNIAFVREYANVLRTDIVGLLDQSNDRAVTIDEEIELLKSYFDDGASRLEMLNIQIQELKSTLSEAKQLTVKNKWDIITAYKALDYDTIENTIDTYVTEQQKWLYSSTYLSFLTSFQKSILALQTKNAKILDTITNNREALIKRTIVVLPDSWTEVLKELQLIQTEEEYKSKK